MSRLRFSLFPTAKVTALALACLLFFSVTAHSNTASLPRVASASRATPKDETIFVNLGSDGAVREVNVVNTFRAARGQLTDYGDYVEVTNLSDTRGITLDAERISVMLDENTETTFRYQGRLEQAALPWLFSFSYYLDGQPVTPSALLGRSGRLELVLAVRPNPLAVRHFAEHYTVQVVVPLLVDRIADVQAAGATAMLVGNRLNLAFTVMPGESHTQAITAMVRDFAMPPIEISAMRVAQLQGAWLDEVDEGFAALAGGMESVIDGSKTLQDGLLTLHQGVGRLRTSLDPLLSHMGQFTTGLEQSAAGVAAFSQGLTTINEGQDALDAGEQRLAASLPALQGGYASIAANSGGVLAEGATVRQLAETLVGHAHPAVRQLAEATLIQFATLEGLLQSLSQANAGLEAYALARAQLGEQRVALNLGLSQAASSGQTLAAGLGELSQAGVSLHGGLQQLPQGVNELHNHTASLPLHVGALVSGQQEINKGLAEARGQLGQFLGDGPVAPVVSFVSPGQATATSVQFVMLTPAIEVAQRVRAETEQPVQTTLWQRIVNLARRFTTMFQQG
ncbi:MAG: hypothetical protein KGZ92_09545 [Firmicutes bacterium]|nr:hypothetical protein [Dethiobacter sp.]MBS3889505.1 hypothetical protein [Bacillota bacterium]